jgi:hypothetical protein
VADEQRERTPLAVSRDPGIVSQATGLDRYMDIVVYMDIMHKASARGLIAGGVSVLWYAARILRGGASRFHTRFGERGGPQ